MAGYALWPNGTAACYFPFAFLPEPAPLRPLALPAAAGGAVSLDLRAYALFLGNISCTLYWGGVAGPRILLSSIAPAHALTAPAGGPGPAPLSLRQCDRLAAGRAVDLGVALLYLPQSAAHIGDAAACVQFRSCELVVTVTYPPQRSPQDGPARYAASLTSRRPPWVTMATGSSVCLGRCVLQDVRSSHAAPGGRERRSCLPLAARAPSMLPLQGVNARPSCPCRT